MTTRCLVVSAVNFTEGGPLTILREFVTTASAVLPSNWTIVVFVHDRSLLEMTRPKVVEIPKAKGGWLYRLYVEWVQFAEYSRTLRPDVWLSLHDITPRVGRIRQAVYCHNPMPFYNLRLRDVWLDPRTLIYRAAYGLIYRLNIRRNYLVIVQQSWMRDAFRRWTGGQARIVVAHPSLDTSLIDSEIQPPGESTRTIFLYPALPRVFKNVELICRAVERLEKLQTWGGEVILTIEGNENRYARWLHRRFGALRTIRFAGRQSAQQMRELYGLASCLIFPSKLESWGLPITEAKRYRLPMLIANLPYARETVGNYDRVNFIDVDDDLDLSRKMLCFQCKQLQFGSAVDDPPAAPFASDWRGLLSLLTVDLD